MTCGLSLWGDSGISRMPGCGPNAGACPGFLKGGGPISLGSLKKGHQILKGGGSNGLKGGGPVRLSHYDDKSCIFRCQRMN